MKIALLQTPVATDKTGNIRLACEELRKAAKEGIDLAVLPEMFCCPYESGAFRSYGEAHGGEAQQALSAVAKELGIYLVGGSVPELEGDRIYNTSYVYDRSGREIARHRKIHMFDINVEGGQSFRESKNLSAGNEITVFDTEFGPMGLCICFDMRFEELSRCMALRGARVIFAPAAFNMTTGPAHWELVFRQRAVDNQCFTVGVSPARNENASYVAYGNSLAVDPWGTVLTRCGGEVCTQIVELDLSQVESIRRQLPILSARRTDLYELREL
ncbi:MAG: carbon-nitrogen hydrolase family protein [Oscillospiraceae bacterium]